jgi:hypothetical protein
MRIGLKAGQINYLIGRKRKGLDIRTNKKKGRKRRQFEGEESQELSKYKFHHHAFISILSYVFRDANPQVSITASTMDVFRRMHPLNEGNLDSAENPGDVSLIVLWERRYL